MDEKGQGCETERCGQVFRNDIETNTSGIDIELDLAHRRADANCIHPKDNSIKPINHRLTKVKSDHIKRFLAHDFL